MGTYNVTKINKPSDSITSPKTGKSLDIEMGLINRILI